MPLSWTDSHSVDVPAIDDDHRALVTIINDLYEAIQVGCPRRILGRILSRLADYAGQHFTREEQIMRHLSYPDLAEHLRQHEELIGRLSQIVFEFETDQSSVAIHMIDLLRDWFEEHVEQHDAAFGRFVRTNFDAREIARMDIRNDQHRTAA